MSAKRPKVVHVYRSPDDGKLCFEYDILREHGVWEYLGEYAPRGPVVNERYEVSWWHDCSGEWQIDGEWHVSEDRRARAKAHEMFRRKKKEWPKAKYRIVHITTRKVCR